jgi:Ca2+/Na+ antiporter
MSSDVVDRVAGPAMNGEQRRASLIATEKWFEDNGLPYFVDSNEEHVHDALAWRRLAPVAGLVLAATAAVGVFVAIAADDGAAGVVVMALLAGVAALVYAFAYLHLRPIGSWAVKRTFGSLGSLFPLITRALPLLLLFMTFLFINTEVWQVTSALNRAFLWLTVMMFAAVAVVFLLVRLPEEVRDVSERARGDRLVSICADTPVADLVGEVSEGFDDAGLTRLQRLNLVLVLLIAQAVQVMLLSVSVFTFFIVFGLVAIKDSVIRAWLGTEADGHPIPHSLPSLDWLPVSNELFQVSVFLAAFSGLYFTVYAVTDENYRRQFFTDVASGLETSIGVQRVYRALRQR